MAWKARIKSFKTEAGRCSSCGKWHRELVGELGDCRRCCNSTMIGVHSGRPIGPKSKDWENVCKSMGLDPGNPVWPHDECKTVLNTWFNWEPVEKEKGVMPMIV